jgi:hypothetical protein
MHKVVTTHMRRHSQSACFLASWYEIVYRHNILEMSAKYSDNIRTSLIQAIFAHYPGNVTPIFRKYLHKCHSASAQHLFRQYPHNIQYVTLSRKCQPNRKAISAQMSCHIRKTLIRTISTHYPGIVIFNHCIIVF